MDPEITRLQHDLQELIARRQQLDDVSRQIERKGGQGSEDLLGEFVGRRVAFELEDGRTLEGKLLLNQLRCLKVATEEGTLVLNTLLVNALRPLDPAPARKPVRKRSAPR